MINAKIIRKSPTESVFCNCYIIIIAGLIYTSLVVSQDVTAQNQTTSAPVTNFTRLVEEQFSFDRLGLGVTLPEVTVMYESPQTLVLRGEGPEFSSLGQVIDIAKQSGFNIDSVTVITESSSSSYSETVRLTDVYTVFMSK